MGLSHRPALLSPPCRPTLALFAFVPFDITAGPLLFSIIMGADVEATGCPDDPLFNRLKRSMGVLVLEICPLLNVVKPELSVTPTPIDRAVVRVV